MGYIRTVTGELKAGTNAGDGHLFALGATTSIPVSRGTGGYGREAIPTWWEQVFQKLYPLQHHIYYIAHLHQAYQHISTYIPLNLAHFHK